jgi:predicted choloylglycine hydrolase
MPFRWVREDQPGARWRRLFDLTWPSYRAWFLKEGDARRPSLELCEHRLAQHMPEMLSLWRQLVELADGDPQVARMLSLYRPTPYLAGCSQAVWLRGEPLLVRNYDYHPSTCEGTFVRSAWDGTRMLTSNDCLWGALDGMNEHGLALALSFGGRAIVGDGFGIPLVLRYALQVCRTTADAIALLRRVPSHMSYNVSVLDAAGAHAVVHLAPDRPATVTAATVATNHQQRVEWTAYAVRTQSAERERFLCEQLQDPSLDAAAFLQLFLQPPLFASQYQQSFGTLYTVAYSPRRRSAVYLWHGARVEQSIDGFREQDLVVPIGITPTPQRG